MAGLRSDIKSMRDLPQEPQTSSFAKYVDSLPEERGFMEKLTGQVGLDPGSPNDQRKLLSNLDAIRTGQLNEDQVKKLMRRNKLSAGLYASAFDEYKKASALQGTEKGILARNFGTQEQFGPTRPGETLLPVQKANYGQAIPELIGAGLTESAGKLSTIEKQMREGGGNKFEGPVLFDLKGNTYRSTGDGKIVPVLVEGGATIAPPVYPYTVIDPVTGQPIQRVITKPQVAGLAAGGSANLGPSSPLKPLPSETQDNLVQGINSLKALRTMRAGFGESGRLKGLLSKGQVFIGENQKAIDFQTAKDNFKLSAQAMIKGIPSNFDVQTVLNTIPDLGLSPEVNKSRADFVDDVFKDLLKRAVGFYKGKGYDIPSEIITTATRLGVDFKSIKPIAEGEDPFDGVQTKVEAFNSKQNKQTPNQLPGDFVYKGSRSK